MLTDNKKIAYTVHTFDPLYEFLVNVNK